MKKADLHPTVAQFKNLMESHPSLKKRMKEEGYTLQEFYEQWYVLGEEPFLNKFLDDEEEETETENPPKEESEEKSEKESTNVSSYIDNAVNIVSTLSGLMSMFKSSPQTRTKETSKTKSLFQFRED